jgi:hypothetical protein
MDKRSVIEHEIFHVEFTTKDKSLNYKIVFLSTNNLRRVNGGDKYYPRITQCIVFCNKLIKGIGTVTQCQLDKDNLKFAIITSAKKALTENINIKWIRKEIWYEIFQIINKH